LHIRLRWQKHRHLSYSAEIGGTALGTRLTTGKARIVYKSKRPLKIRIRQQKCGQCGKWFTGLHSCAWIDTRTGRRRSKLYLYPDRMVYDLGRRLKSQLLRGMSVQGMLDYRTYVPLHSKLSCDRFSTIRGDENIYPPTQFAARSRSNLDGDHNSNKRRFTIAVLLTLVIGLGLILLTLGL